MHSIYTYIHIYESMIPMRKIIIKCRANTKTGEKIVLINYYIYCFA